MNHILVERKPNKATNVTNSSNDSFEEEFIAKFYHRAIAFRHKQILVNARQFIDFHKFLRLMSATVPTRIHK